MVKIFDQQFSGLYQPKRVPEKEWFVRFQNTLLWFANTYDGRDFFCIDQNFPRIDEIGPNYIKTFLQGDEIMAEFHTAPKYANRIRHSWNEFCEALRFQPQLDFLTNSPIAISSRRYLTGTFYPEPNPGTTSCDGYAGRDGFDESFGTMRGGAGSGSSASDTADYMQLESSATSNQYRSFYRSFYLFDTSSIGSGNTVTSGTISLYGSSSIDHFSQSVCIVSTTPASNTTIVNGDYSNTSTTEQSSTRITLASWSNSGYNDFTLSATGIASVSLTSITKFGGKLSGDLDNTAPTWSSSLNARARAIQADTAGTTTDPKLVIVYTLPVSTRSPSGGVGNSSSFIII